MEKKTYSDASKTLNTVRDRKQMHQTLLFLSFGSLVGRSVAISGSTQQKRILAYFDG